MTGNCSQMGSGKQLSGSTGRQGKPASKKAAMCPLVTSAVDEGTPCEVFRRGKDLNRNATSVLGPACARSSTLYTQRHTPRLHRLLDTQA